MSTNPVVDLVPTVCHWIGGQRVTPAATRTADVYNPASGQVIARVALAESADVDVAVRIQLTRLYVVINRFRV